MINYLLCGSTPEINISSTETDDFILLKNRGNSVYMILNSNQNICRQAADVHVSQDSMIIRAFSTEDFEAIESIYNLSKLDELRYENREFELLPLSKDQLRLRSLLESQICVFEDQLILGYGAYLESEIRALFVHPAYRGKGVGSKLLSHMLQQASHPATLYVAKTNRPAKLLYARYGFQVTEEFSTTYNGVSVFANKMERLVGGG